MIFMIVLLSSSISSINTPQYKTIFNEYFFYKTAFEIHWVHFVKNFCRPVSFTCHDISNNAIRNDNDIDSENNINIDTDGNSYIV